MLSDWPPDRTNLGRMFSAKVALYKQILTNPRLVQFGSNLAQFVPNSDTPDHKQNKIEPPQMHVDRQGSQIWHPNLVRLATNGTNLGLF